MNPVWSNWMYRLFKKANAKKTQKEAQSSPQLRFEHLEDRVVPAHNITILDSGVGTLDSLLNASQGTIAITDGGNGGNNDETLSRAALLSVGATTDISISARASITFNSLSSTLALQTGGGHAATFNSGVSGAGSITFSNTANILSTAGAGLVFHADNAAGGSLALGSLTGSSLTATANGNIDVTSSTTTGAATLTSATGHVNSTGTVQTAAQLTATAATGINLTTSAVTLQATNNNTGDIVVSQTLAPSQLLTITNTAGGVVNHAAGGKITITDLGSGIQLAQSAIVQSNGGNITLTAQDLIIDTSGTPATINANNGTVGAGGGIVTLAPTSGAQVDLGTNTSGKFSLTQQEIDRVTGASNLRVGANNSGTFTITNAITSNATYNNTLTLISGAAMTETAAGTVTAPNLRLSGTGPITLQRANNVGTLSADLTASPGPSGALLFANGTNALIVGNVDTDTGITTLNSDVTLVADTLNIAQQINTNTSPGGIVTLRPFTAARVMTIGAGNTGLGISDTMLGRITAKEVTLGESDAAGSATGTITVDGAVTRHSGFNTLALETSNSTANAITQTAALSVAKLNLETGGGNVTLTNANNLVDSLAANVTSFGAPAAEVFAFTNSAGFVIDSVDGINGITTDTVAGARVTLTAGGAVTQNANDNIITTGLQLLGTGPYTLNNAGNSAGTLAANLTTSGTGSLSYQNAGPLTIGTVNGTVGITTNNSDVNIQTANGNLTVSAANPVNAGTGSVALTAGDTTGSGGPETVLTIGAAVTGTGTTGSSLFGVSLVGDNVAINAAVNAGSAFAQINPFETGVNINLGGADALNTLGLTQAELNNITAGIVRVGDFGNTNNITITTAITAPATWNTLSLLTNVNGAISQNNATPITVTNLQAAGAVSVTLNDPNNSVSNFAAASLGAVSFTDKINLDVTTVDGTLVNGSFGFGQGIQTFGSSITVNVINNSSLTVDQRITTGGLGATTGTGNISLSATDNVTANAAISTVGSGSITITTDSDNAADAGDGNFLSTAGGTLSTKGGGITVQGGTTGLFGNNATFGAAVTITGGNGIVNVSTGNDVNVNAAVSVTGSGGINVTNASLNSLTGNFNSNVNGTLSTNGGSIVINGGTAGGFGNIANISGAITVTGGNGGVSVSEARDINADAAVTVTGAGGINMIADSNLDGNGAFFSNAAGTLSTQGGGISITSIAPGQNSAGNNVVIGAAVTITGGVGSVSVIADASITVNAAVLVTGSGHITMNADHDQNGNGTFTSNPAGTLTTQGGSTGNIFITAADVNIGAAINATTTANSDIFLTPSFAAAVVHLGDPNDTAFGLTNAEMNFLTANAVIVGSTTNTGGIQLNGPVTLNPAKVATLELISNGAGGAITDNDATEQTDLTVQNLLLIANSGIGATGAGNDLDLAVTNLAAVNTSTTAGAININNTATTLNLTTVATNTASFSGVGNLNANGSTGSITVATTGAMDVKQPVSTAGGGGTGAINLDAGTSFTLDPSTNIQAGDSNAGGNITIRSNVGNNNGTADITIGAHSNVLTRGNITLDADPDANGVGGGLNIDPTAMLAGPGGTRAFDIFLRAGKDIIATTFKANDNITIVTSGNILDDTNKSTGLIAGNNIFLTAGGRIGGTANPLTTADVESAATATPTTGYLALLDVTYGDMNPSGGLFLTQTGALGNVGIRKVGPTGFHTSELHFSTPLAGTGNQIALVSAGGDFTVDNNFVLNGANNSDLFLATTAGHNFTINAVSSLVNNGATAVTTIMTSGSATAGIVDLASGDNNADITVQNLVLVTTGGNIGAVATPLEFNAVTLDNVAGGGFTNGRPDGVNKASGGSAYLTDTANGIAVGQINAGKGDVVLKSLGLIQTGLGTGSSIVAVNANDGIPEIIGNNITLDTTVAPQAANSGNAGQIGFSNGTGQFFEVTPGTNGGTLTATTNNSQAWLSLIGGGTINQVNVGTNTANIKTVNGTVLGSHATGTPDILAGTQTVLTGQGGGFGVSAGRLQTNSPILSASVTGAGDIHVLGLNGSGLTVNAATTANGNVDIGALNGPLQLGSATATGNVVNAAGTVFLNTSNADVLFGVANSGPAGTSIVTATGALSVSAAGAGSQIKHVAPTNVLDATAASVQLQAGAGIGVFNSNSFDTATAILAASTTTGGVNVNNTSANLDINTLGSTAGVSATTSGPITVTTSGNLSVTSNVSGAGNIGLTSSTGNVTTTGSVATTAGTVGITATAGTLSVGGSVSASNAVTLSSNGTLSTTGAGTVSAGSTVTANSGTGTMSIGALIQGGGAVGLTAGGNLSTTAAVTSTGSTVNATSTGGTLSVGATLSGNGNVTLGSSGNLSTTANVSSTTGSIGATTTGGGGVSVGGNLTAGTTVTLTATDTNTTGQDITIAAGKTVSATGGGNVQLLAGDNITVNGSITTTGNVQLTGDNGNADAVPGTTISITGAGTNTVSGANVTLQGGNGTNTFNIGSQTAVTGTTVTLNGGTGLDTFNVKPQTGTQKLTISGGAPSTLPGDSLNVTGDLGTTLNSTGVGAGTFSFTNGGNVVFTGIESLSTATPFALSLDLVTLGFTGNALDNTNVSTTAGVNPALNVTVNGTSVFNGAASNVSSLTINGSTDATMFTIDETNPGIPTGTFNGKSTGGKTSTLVVNTTNTTNIAFTPGAPGAGMFTFGNRNPVNFTGIQTVSTNVISIAATKATASETGYNQSPDVAVFTLTRTGDVSNQLTVFFQISGTAVNGKDYVAIPSSATFLAGSSTAVVTITPLNNSDLDGTRTVTLTLVAGVGYAFSAGASASAQISDNDSVPSAFAVSSLTGSVSVTNSSGATSTFTPFPGISGPVSVAVGDINGDGIPDYAIAPGIGGPSIVTLVDGATGGVMGTIVVLGGTYTGGLSLAIGDLDGNGRGEVVVGLMTGLPAVGVFDGMTGALRTAFLAYSVATAGGPQPSVFIGVNVAVGDLNGDGKAEIVVTPRGIAPVVSVFDGNGNLQQQFLAFSPAFGAVGLTVAVGDLDGDGKDEIITGAFLPAGTAIPGTYVQVFNGNGTLRQSLAIPTLPPTAISDFGPSVGAADVNHDGKQEILVTDGQFLGMLDPQTFALLSVTIPFPGQPAGTIG